MRRHVSVAVSHSLVLVMDRTVGEIPETMDGLVSSTPGCVAVGTTAQHDGETRISLSDEGVEPGPAQWLAFDGVLQTPSRRLSICSVLDEVLLQVDVPSSVTGIEVWVDHEMEPTSIAVVITRPPDAEIQA